MHQSVEPISQSDAYNKFVVVDLRLCVEVFCTKWCLLVAFENVCVQYDIFTFIEPFRPCTMYITCINVCKSIDKLWYLIVFINILLFKSYFFPYFNLCHYTCSICKCCRNKILTFLKVLYRLRDVGLHA